MGKHFELKTSKQKIFKPLHKAPGEMRLDYILLPYGPFYDKTKDFVNAKKGDILRFFNGPEYEIDSVALIRQDRLCDILCRMRYGISWDKAFAQWKRYALLEGNGHDVLSATECLFVAYAKKSLGET